MAKRRSNDLTRARAEAAALLRLDAEHLSTADALRCDIVASLRLVIDAAQADVLSGTSSDLGKLLVAVETLTKLLPARAEAVRPDAHGNHGAKEKVLQLLVSAIEADAVELRERAERVEGGEQSEVAQLRREVALLRARLGEQPQVEGAPTVTEPKVIGDVPTSAIIPPGEIGECYAGHRPAPDDGKYTKPKVVIDAKAEPAEKPWRGPQDGPPSWLKPVPQVAPEDRPPAAPPQTRSGDETKAAMDRVNSDRSAFYQHLAAATHSEPWRDYVGADSDILMRPRGGRGFP